MNTQYIWSFSRKHPKKIGVGVLLFSLVTFVAFANFGGVTESLADISQVKSPPSLKTTHPTLSNEFSVTLLNGMVVSHEAAEVHARREGIVKDVFVDLGDAVTKGQILATLLPRGVEGESDAIIAQKNAEVAKARSEYENALLIQQESIATANASLYEKETQLSSALATKTSAEDKAMTDIFSADEVALANTENARQAVHLAEENLQAAKNNLEQAQKNEAAQGRKSETSLQEATNQGEIALRHALQIAHQVLFDDEEDTRELIRSSDLPYYFGFRDTKSRGNFSQSASAFQNSKEENIETRISLAEDMMAHLNTLLSNTLSGSEITQAEIDARIQIVHSAEDKLATAKEKYHLALNSQETVDTTQEKEIVRLKGQVAQLTEALQSAQTQLQLIESKNEQMTQSAKTTEAHVRTTESGKIETLEKQVELAQENVDMIKALQKRNVDAAQNLLNVTNAALSAELSKSGHIEIVSPFEGIVTRRNIAVGDEVGVQKEVFELIEVSSELSKEARITIHFGIPENLARNIAPGTKGEIALFDGTLSSTWREIIVTRRSQTVDPQTHLVEAQAELLEDVSLSHNATVRVRIVTSDPIIWKVRSTAVKRNDGGNILWILSKNDGEKENTPSYQSIPVEIFSEDGEWAHVIGDISEETDVILSPPESFLTK